MATARRWVTELATTPPAGLVTFLLEHSGLPGPRANLGLLEAVARTVPDDTLDDLARSPEEYLRMCGTAGLGRLLTAGSTGAGDGSTPTSAEVSRMLHERAADPSWRVREAAAMALQILGDSDRAALCTVVADWVQDPDPLVRRAAVAGICEPRLLTDPSTRRAALAACLVTTGSIRSVPRTLRADPGLRTLRQALGYAWSVAVAASPEDGLDEMGALGADDDPDVAWIVRNNLTKARLRRLLGPAVV